MATEARKASKAGVASSDGLLRIVFGIARDGPMVQGTDIVSSKKNREKAAVPTMTESSVRVGMIRLRPSRSDYASFVTTTALAMGRTASSASGRKPNKRLLSLLNLGA